MKAKFNFICEQSLPQNLEKLKLIANNYWWSWNADAIEFFKSIDEQLFENSNNNPILLLNSLSQSKIMELEADNRFVADLNKIYAVFIEYKNKSTAYDGNKQDIVAYFSPEFGIHESFPNYSGGLGILSGDHLKSASDLGIPLVGIGLLYQEGYFRQVLTQNGWQSETYPENDFFSMPITSLKDNLGNDLVIKVDIENDKVYAKIWQVDIGNTILYLLDTNIESNSQDNRGITKRLYGGNRNTRIKQEILLGIGGVKVLDLLNIKVKVIHINEGHAAFALLERTNSFMKKFEIDFWSAVQITIASSVFTTHTPVPAGNEEFSHELINKYLTTYCKSLGIELTSLINMGTRKLSTNFSMTVLAINLSSIHNGVSKLHQQTSQEMWAPVWTDFFTKEVPIDYITNGIHTKTWLSKYFNSLFERYLGNGWTKNISDKSTWEKVGLIPNKELFKAKKEAKIELINFTRTHLSENKSSYLNTKVLHQMDEVLDYNTLTIGFARRFATYKRASLLFTDMQRLKNILLNNEKPVQIIIAGKAHPHDTAGKENIQALINNIKHFNLEKHIVFLEDYDIKIAKYMVHGADLWLNTPIKPYEASGTSGMKNAINAGLNCSILDGWWDEAFDGNNGFAIGDGEIYEDKNKQNSIEASKLYDLLEYTITDKYYSSGQPITDMDSFSQTWYDMLINNFKSIGHQYNSDRMLKEYNNYYDLAKSKYDTFTDNNATSAVGIKIWKELLHSQWDVINLFDASAKQAGNGFDCKVNMYYGDLKASDLKVQVVYGVLDSKGEFTSYETIDMNLTDDKNKISKYEIIVENKFTGRIGLSFRIIPDNELLTNFANLKLVKWIDL